MRMWARIFFALTLVFVLDFAHGFEPGASVVVKTDTTRQINNEHNPFVHKCFGTPEFPNLAEPKLEIEKDARTNQFILNYSFKSDSDLYLILDSGPKVKIAHGDHKTYRLTILRPASKANQVQLRFALDAGEGLVQYRLEADAIGSSARISTELTPEQMTLVCLKSQLWVGVGGSAFFYQQDIAALEAQAKFRSFKLGSYHAEGRWYATPNFGLLASYKNAPGEMSKGAVEGVEATEFNWSIWEIATQYRRSKWLTEWKSLMIYPYLRSSIQYHSMPRLGIDESEILFFDKLEFADATLGIGANVFTEQFYFLEVYLNAKYPIWGNGVDISPSGVMSDGGLGFGKSMGSNFALGAYWYGHWDRLSYRSHSGRDTNPGNLNFFFSNFDVRLGYLF